MSCTNGQVSHVELKESYMVPRILTNITGAFRYFDNWIWVFLWWLLNMNMQRLKHIQFLLQRKKSRQSICIVYDIRWSWRCDVFIWLVSWRPYSNVVGKIGSMCFNCKLRAKCAGDSCSRMYVPFSIKFLLFELFFSLIEFCILSSSQQSHKESSSRYAVCIFV